MIIIYGSRAFQKVFGNTAPQTCGYCKEVAELKVFRVSKWFTLFYIPLFPFSYKYYLQCPYCEVMSEISKEEAKSAVAKSEQK